MTTDVNIMEEMLERATNPERENVDELGVQMFCMVAKNNIQKAQDMIVCKVQSRNETESVRAIALLEECMAKCGSEFQDQIGKFRFLNNLIRLVSQKYEGATTPQPIKRRIMECLLLWTTAYPQKEKIREAYDNLNKEGGVEHGNTMVSVANVAVAKTDSILGEDEEKLKKLLQSKNPEDYKRANVLIQYRVNQEARRTEFRAQQKSNLQEVDNTTSLLNQMLDTYESDGSKDVDDAETKNLIRELYKSCKRHRPILEHLIEMNEIGDEDLVGDTLETNDALLAVMKRYESTNIYRSSKSANSRQTKGNATADNSNTTSDLLTSLLDDIPSTSLDIVVPSTTNTTANANYTGGTSTSKTLEELNEIFGNLNPTNATTPISTQSIFNSLEVLEPIAVEANTAAISKPSDELNQSQKRPLREMRELNELSAELFKKNLPTTATRMASFKKDPEKLTLNDLVKEKTNITVPHVTTASRDKSKTCVDHEAGAEAVENVKVETKKEIDDVMLKGAEHEHNITIEAKQSILPDSITADDAIKCKEPVNSASNVLPVTHLSNISIDLDEVVATADERTLLDDDDIRITLNFTENRPSAHVSVIVISAENKSKLHVRDFQFEASVKKPNKVRLLPSSDTSMPPFKRFRPPTPINQIMLLMNPTGQPVDVTCIVGYKMGDDPDAIKECINVKDIPFVE